MFNCQSELKSKVIRMTDVQGMTPLHRAAMGDHVDVIEYLLDAVRLFILLNIYSKFFNN